MLFLINYYLRYNMELITYNWSKYLAHIIHVPDASQSLENIAKKLTEKTLSSWNSHSEGYDANWKLEK